MANLGKVVLILIEAPLVAFAAIAVAEILIGGAGMVLVYWYKGNSIRNWSGSFHRAKYLLKNSWPIILSGFFIQIYMRIDQVMLGELAGNDSVGIYSTAVMVSEAWYFIATIIMASFYPFLVTQKKGNDHLYKISLQKLHDGLFSLALVIAIIVTFTSQGFIEIMFGEEFSTAGTVLSIHVWAAIFVFQGVIRLRFLIIENKQHFSIWFDLMGALLNIIFNVLLIPKYGINGAAWATLLSYSSPVFILSFFHPFNRLIALMCLKSYLFPIRVMIYKKEIYR